MAYDRHTFKVFLALVFLCAGVIQVEPAVRIISPTENLIIRFSNQTVLFNCTLTGPPSHSGAGFLWLRNNRVIPNIIQKDSSSWSSFELKNFSPQDEGEYMCINGGTSSVKVYLASVPKVKQTGGHVDFPYTAGTFVTIECEARGWPRPKITWLKDNKSIADINHNNQYLVKTIPRQDDRVIASQLKILAIQKEESGIYACKATNALKVVTKNITVLVEEPELFKIRLTAEEPQYTEEVGKDASLSCLGEPVKNDPFTWVYWELNGTRLNTSTHHYDDSRIYSNSNNGATPKVHMKLIIFNVDYSDEGNYTCVVYSFSERVSDSISLQIKELQKVSFTGNGGGMEVWLIVVPVVATLLVVLILVIIIVKWRQNILDRKMARLAQKYEQENFYHAFENDVFVSYSFEDYDWVVETLLPVLEKRNVKYIVRSQDFKPGKGFYDSMANSVYNSRKVLLVMSANYFSNDFCMEEMQMALYRSAERDDDSLILVRIDNTEIKDIPKTLRHKTFIDFTSREEVATWQNRILESVVSEDRSTLNGIPHECTDSTRASDTFQLIL